MEQKRAILLQFELTPENDSNLHKYQGGYMLLHGKKITKGEIVNKAIALYLKDHLDFKDNDACSKP